MGADLTAEWSKCTYSKTNDVLILNDRDSAASQVSVAVSGAWEWFRSRWVGGGRLSGAVGSGEARLTIVGVDAANRRANRGSNALCCAWSGKVDCHAPAAQLNIAVRVRHEVAVRRS